MFFYTQIKSAAATTIEHRWYQGDRLRQAVQLRIQPNSGAGYRTYSRTTISSKRLGDWRVELRSEGELSQTRSAVVTVDCRQSGRRSLSPTTMSGSNCQARRQAS
jgi:hypothetical protein